MWVSIFELPFIRKALPEIETFLLSKMRTKRERLNDEKKFYSYAKS
jgi:hypothetical protein